MNQPHEWETEEVDGGMIGVGLFYICRECGAAGGPYMDHVEGPIWCFLPGPALELDENDCDEAKRQIAEWNAQAPEREIEEARLRAEALDRFVEKVCLKVKKLGPEHREMIRKALET